jgi:hypothetical protein
VSKPPPADQPQQPKQYEAFLFFVLRSVGFFFEDVFRDSDIFDNIWMTDLALLATTLEERDFDRQNSDHTFPVRRQP